MFLPWILKRILQEETIKKLNSEKRNLTLDEKLGVKKIEDDTLFNRVKNLVKKIKK